jgi:ABC-type Fe3+/spermidine/putrescine transport system ATPase subunit
MAGPLLRVDGVAKTYGESVRALRGVSVDLSAGEILCLLGPSGCGKTTLLRVIAGLEIPDSGRIVFDGRDMSHVPPHEREFGMMFQDFALFPHLNVFDNVAFGLKMRRLPPAEIAGRVREMLALVALEGKERRAMTELSGGEQQRVALARALAPRPALVLLDEPLGALDRALRERLMLEVRDILKKVGVTAVYVTHDQTEAFAIADRMAVMNAGRIEQVDTPQVTYRQPATPFVAAFLGFHNLLNGRVEQGGVVHTAVGRFRPETALPEGTPVTLLIKPQDPVIGPGGKGRPAINEIEARVRTLSFRGRFCQVWLEAGGESLLFEPSEVGALAEGDAVRVSVQVDALLVYEAFA